MSRIIARKGQYVAQGEVIGLVDSTGLATDPHVCYRFWKSGVQVDPLKEKLPDAVPIDDELKAPYLEYIKPLRAQLDNLQNNKQMSRIRLFWIIAALLTIATAVVFFPIEAFEKGGIYYALLMGVLIGLLSFLAMAEITTFSVLRTAMPDKEAPTNTPMNASIPVMVLIVAGFAIYQLINYRTDYPLKTEGLYVEAIIERGQRETIKRIGGISESYKVQMSFTDAKTTKQYTFSTAVPKEFFNMIYKGQHLKMLYLPKQPTVLRLMTGRNVERYQERQNRKLQLQDLNTLFATSPAEVSEALKRISPMWEVTVEDELPDRPLVIEGHLFKSDQLQESLLISSHGIALYGSGYTYDFTWRTPALKQSETTSLLSEDGKSEKVKLYETTAYTVKRVEVITFRASFISIEAYYLVMTNRK